MDALFNAMGQVIVLGVGLIFALIGGFIILDHFAWNKKGRRVKAVIVGMREELSKLGEPNSGQTQMLYYPVVEYMSRDGKTIRAECDSGSSGYIKMMPGKRITVLVRDEKPEQFRLIGKGFLIFGAIFGLIGLGACVVAANNFVFTVYTPMLVVLFVLWFGLKIKKAIKPRSEWEKPAAFKARRSEEFKEKREALPLLDAAAMRARQRKQEVMQRKYAWVPLLVGGVFCGICYYIWQDTGGSPNQDEWIAIGVTGGMGSLVTISTLWSMMRSGTKRF